MKWFAIGFLMLAATWLTGCGKDGGLNVETDTLTDIDGNTYEVVKIGEQWWMAENLRVRHFRNGEEIPMVGTAQNWSTLKTAAVSIYQNRSANEETYGLLYNHYAVNDPRSIAPEGWRVPTDEDWKVLERFLGIPEEELDDVKWRGDNEGGKLKKKGTKYWVSPNEKAKNSYGFAALPGGMYSYDYLRLGYYAYFWTATESSSGSAWSRSLGYAFAAIHRYSENKVNGYSVRLIKE